MSICKDILFAVKKLVLLYGGVLQSRESKHTQPVLLLLDHYSSHALHPLLVLDVEWLH